MSWFCVECGKPNPEERDTCRSCGTRSPEEDRTGVIPPAGRSAPRLPAVSSVADGALLGRYRVERHIASGGFATVHLARDTATGAEVALKILASNLVHHQKLVERFRQEARIQSGLQHPGIVRVYDVVEAAGSVALVMEFVRGTTLAAHLERIGRPVTAAECREVLVPMLDALEYAHRAGVVHRDLKPSNVLLEEAAHLPVGYWPKLADFGVAKLFDEAGVRTLTGATLGTPSYMAPEQCRGERSVDHRADVYSAGIMLFEMVTGRVPFEGDSEYAVWEGHIRQVPPRPRALNPGLSPELEEVILQAIEKDPAERFQSAVALRDALQASSVPSLPSPVPVFASAPIRPTVPAGGGEEARANRRRTVVAVVVAALSVLLVTLGAVLAAHLSGSYEGASGPADATFVPEEDAPGVSGDAPDPPAGPDVAGANDVGPEGGGRSARRAEPPLPRRPAVVPRWPEGGNRCGTPTCGEGWPECWDSAGTRCSDTNCGECAEELLESSPGPDSDGLATAFCIGQAIIERASRTGQDKGDQFRRQGWGFQLIGRAMDLRGCPDAALSYYIASATRRIEARQYDPELGELPSFLKNCDMVVDWCRKLGEYSKCSCWQ